MATRKVKKEKKAEKKKFKINFGVIGAYLDGLVKGIIIAIAVVFLCTLLIVKEVSKISSQNISYMRNTNSGILMRSLGNTID